MKLVTLAFALPFMAQAQMITRVNGTSLSGAHADSLARRVLEKYAVTGAQIAVVNDGKLVWSGAYGERRREPSLPFDNETVTWAASITKSVFSTYVMQLVEKGEFDLDLPIAKQLTKPLNEYPAYKETGAELVRDPRWPLVTPRMLLAHSSGLLNFAFLEPDKKMHLHSAPGTLFQYSGEGINLVQFAIEQRKGVSLDTLMQNAIFGPLGMTRAGMIYRSEFAPNVADRYGKDGNFLSQTKRYPARGAGSLMTSAEDLARFASGLLENRIISSTTRAAMLTPFLKISSVHQFPFAENEGVSHETEAVGLSYGVGWGVLTKTPFGPAFFKEGHGDGAQNYMICFERSKSCMVILTNSDNGEFAFRELLEGILGDTVTPWEWEGYTPSYIERARKP